MLEDELEAVLDRVLESTELDDRVLERELESVLVSDIELEDDEPVLVVEEVVDLRSKN